MDIDLWDKIEKKANDIDNLLIRNPDRGNIKLIMLGLCELNKKIEGIKKQKSEKIKDENNT